MRCPVRRPPAPQRDLRDPRFFRENIAPVYFFGATAFNLLGIDRWVRNFSYVAYFDSWDGGHPRVFSPSTSGP